MKRNVLTALAIVFLATDAPAQGLDSFYKPGPDSLEQEGCPSHSIVTN